VLDALLAMLRENWPVDTWDWMVKTDKKEARQVEL